MSSMQIAGLGGYMKLSQIYASLYVYMEDVNMK